MSKDGDDLPFELEGLSCNPTTVFIINNTPSRLGGPWHEVKTVLGGAMRRRASGGDDDLSFLKHERRRLQVVHRQ